LGHAYFTVALCRVAVACRKQRILDIYRKAQSRADSEMARVDVAGTLGWGQHVERAVVIGGDTHRSAEGLNRDLNIIAQRSREAIGQIEVADVWLGVI
jgi:hypothetical protein